MNTNDLFNPGPSSAIIPEGDAARQAVHSLRGYAYQALVTALAWVDISEHDRLFLEVAEDYALIAKRALNAVQIKDTEISGSVTLNSESICKAVAAFVDLVERNPDIPVNLRFWTTSEIGIERDRADRPAGIAGLKYWEKVAAGANVSPLRSILESKRFPESVRKFSKSRNPSGLCSSADTRARSTKSAGSTCTAMSTSLLDGTISGASIHWTRWPLSCGAWTKNASGTPTLSHNPYTGKMANQTTLGL